MTGEVTRISSRDSDDTNDREPNSLYVLEDLPVEKMHEYEKKKVEKNRGCPGGWDGKWIENTQERESIIYKVSEHSMLNSK